MQFVWFYLYNSAAILVSTKQKNFLKYILYDKWNAIFRNTLYALLDYMVTILISNTSENRILELTNN